MLLVLIILLIYADSGVVLSKLLLVTQKREDDHLLSVVSGMAAGPIMVSWILYLLLFLFPNRDPHIYVTIICSVYVVVFFILKKYRVAFNYSLVRMRRLLSKKLSINQKVGVIFVLSVTLLTIVRIVFYPPTWGDVYEYLHQGYVYAQDMSLSRLGTSRPYYQDNSFYVMNASIRPGIPILYSLFFMVSQPTALVLSITQWVYLYYYFVLLFALLYGAKMSGVRGYSKIWTLVVVLGCFYLPRFTIYGGKEIILMALSTVAVLALVKISDRINKIDWHSIFIFGLMLGFGSYINWNGTIIAGILGISLFLWTKGKLIRRFIVGFVALLVILVFGAGEPISGTMSFIFNPALLSSQKVASAEKLESVELSNYQLIEIEKGLQPVSILGQTIPLITHNEWNLFFKGKIQAFTQPQFFGLVYPLFVLTLFFVYKSKKKLTRMEKIILTYIVVYFFTIMDPFSLNPHHYAYVLAISPKYSLMLVPMLALVVGSRYQILIYYFSKLKMYWLSIVSLMGVTMFIPMVRDKVVANAFYVINETMSLSSVSTYYQIKLNQLGLVIASGSLLLLLLSLLKKKPSVLLLFVILTILTPTLWFMDNNFSYYLSMRYLFSPSITKLTKGEVLQDNRDVFELSDYINSNLPPDSTIVMLENENRLPFYIENRKRLRMVAGAFLLSHLEEYLMNGSIKPDYVIYTDSEADLPIMDIVNTTHIKQIGKFYIDEVVY